MIDMKGGSADRVASLAHGFEPVGVFGPGSETWFGGTASEVQR